MMEDMDMVAGHCPKCLSIDILEVSKWKSDPQLECQDCGFVFASEEVVIGVDPVV